jgi:hypothetical protein
VQTVPELHYCGYPSQSKMHQAIATGLGLKDAMVGGPHGPSLIDLICPEHIAILEKMQQCPRVQDAGRAPSAH